MDSAEQSGRTRLAQEADKLDPVEEQALAEEGIPAELETWPEYESRWQGAWRQFGQLKVAAAVAGHFVGVWGELKCRAKL